MEIQWVIIADSTELERGILTIRHIFQEAIADGPPYLVSFVMVAKVHQEIAELGEEKNVTVDIKNDVRESVAVWNLTYPMFSLDEWLKGSPYIVEPQTIPFPKPGDYIFEVYVDEEFQTSEWLTVVDKKGIQ